MFNFLLKGSDQSPTGDPSASPTAASTSASASAPPPALSSDEVSDRSSIRVDYVQFTPSLSPIVLVFRQLPSLPMIPILLTEITFCAFDGIVDSTQTTR
jgi:hypothetical protein